MFMPQDPGQAMALGSAVRPHMPPEVPRPPKKRNWVWNLLGCLIPLAFFIVCFVVLWFLGLSSVITHPPRLP